MAARQPVPDRFDAPIHCEALSKHFGVLTAVSMVDFSLSAGEILALVGPNGAGKSTLIECLTGLLEPSSGRVRIWGENAAELPQPHRARMGYVPQSFDAFGWFRVDDLLEYMAQFYPGVARAPWPELADWAQLDGRARVKRLSGGQRQRLAIVLALRHRPELLILDEPVSSLDPVARRDFLHLLGDYVRSSAATVLLSSHIVSDLEQLATRVLMMERGIIKADFSMREFRETWRWLRRGDGRPWGEESSGWPVLAFGQDRHAILVGGWDDALQAQWEAQAGTPLFAEVPANLESVFFAILQRAEP